MPDYLQAHQDFNEELNVEHYQRLAEQGLVHASEITTLADENKLEYNQKGTLHSSWKSSEKVGGHGSRNVSNGAIDPTHSQLKGTVDDIIEPYDAIQ